MKRNGDGIDTIKLTLTHYKHSNPAEPVNLYYLSGSTSVPCQSITCILNLRGTSPGPLFLLARSLFNFKKIFY